MVLTKLGTQLVLGEIGLIKSVEGESVKGFGDGSD